MAAQVKVELKEPVGSTKEGEHGVGSRVTKPGGVMSHCAERAAYCRTRQGVGVDTGAVVETCGRLRDRFSRINEWWDYEARKGAGRSSGNPQNARCSTGPFRSCRRRTIYDVAVSQWECLKYLYEECSREQAAPTSVSTLVELGGRSCAT